MLKITFLLNGKPVNPNDIGNIIMRDILTGIENHLRETVGMLSCPIHHESPKITVNYDGDNLSYSVDGCCNELMNLVGEQLHQDDDSDD